MWNSKTFPSDSNTHQTSFPLTPSTLRGDSGKSDQTITLLFEQLILSEMPFSHFPSGKLLIFESSTKVLLLWSCPPLRINHSLFFPTFSHLNSYSRSHITVWFALCKCLPPSPASDRLQGKDLLTLGSITPNTIIEFIRKSIIKSLIGKFKISIFNHFCHLIHWGELAVWIA